MLTIIVSCEKETKIDIPTNEAQIAVSSILSANKIIELFVSESLHVTDVTEKPINNATVLLYENNKFLGQILHDTAGVYRSKTIKPQTGNSYKLEVLVGGYDLITAETFMPLPVNVDSIKIERYVGTSANGRALSSLFLFFTDTSNILSYYQYNCFNIADSTTVDSMEIKHLSLDAAWWYSYDAAILAEGDEQNTIFTNELYQNNHNRLDLMYEEPDDFFINPINYTVNTQILSLSKELYLYSKSLKLYNESFDNVWTINTPPKVYSNINGGYGIFAAISTSNVESQYINNLD